LYGLKTSAARSHEHLSESILKLGFKKTKHDHDLCMVDKSSHYEYLATYVDEILIWSKDSMTVIEALEKTYMLKSVGIPEYYLGGKFGIPWRSMEESGVTIISFYNYIHQNHNFEI
jgi:hypothetical protein